MTTSAERILDLERLSFETGAHILLQQELASVRPGEELGVTGADPALTVHLEAWCRQNGHRVRQAVDTDFGVRAWVVRGRADLDRWAGAVRAGSPGPEGIVESPPSDWGLAARGALIESGGPDTPFDITHRDLVWAEIAPSLYRNAVSAQWNPDTAVDWTAEVTNGPEIEHAVVQVMTYLIENEQAALVIPSQLLARVHPHFREVVQLLAVQAADEARHMEVFTRRALLRGGEMGTSSVSGRESLATLLSEAEFSMASFLLSVLGEGSFLNLLEFLDKNAPDPVTRQVTRLARRDEARHVAFGVAHLQHQADLDPEVRVRMRAARWNAGIRPWWTPPA